MENFLEYLSEDLKRLGKLRMPRDPLASHRFKERGGNRKNLRQVPDYHKVKKTSTGLSTVTISASAGTIDGATTTTLTTQYSSYTFISDGSTNWWII